MNPSTFQNIEDIERILDYEPLWSFEPLNPRQTPQQQLNTPHERMQWLDQHSQPSLQSSTDMQNQITDPIQLQIQAQVAAQARCKIQQLQVQINMLQSQVDAEQTQMQSQQTEQQPYLQLHTELHTEYTEQGLSADKQMDVHPESQYEDLLAQIPHLQTSMDIIPAPQSFCGVSYLPPDFQPLEPGNAHTEDIEVDEIQPNIPPEQPKKPKSQKASRRAKAHSTDQNPPKRRRIEKNSNKNSNDPLRVGSTTNANNSNAMRVGGSEGQVKCPVCDILFADLNAMQRHFRMLHRCTDMKANICLECEQQCRSEANLRRHWNNAHGGKLEFFCDMCGAGFSSNRSRSLHRTKQHSDRYKPRPKRKRSIFHKCKLCDYTSNQKNNVALHFFAKHTDKAAAWCPRGCGKTFKSVSNAKVHSYSCKFRPLV